MSTQIEGGGQRQPVDEFFVRKVPSKRGIVYYVEAGNEGPRIIESWSSLLDWFIQAVGPEPPKLPEWKPSLLECLRGRQYGDQP